MRQADPVLSMEWVAGTWLMMERAEDRDLGGCASGLPVQYRADGTYTVFEGEEGVWRLDGDRLTETATEAHDTIDPAEVAIGQPFVSRLQRRSRDEMLKTFASGERALFRRCPPQP